MKRNLIVCLLISVWLLIVVSAQASSAVNFGEVEINGLMTSKEEIIDYFGKIDYDTTYTDLYYCYESIEAYPDFLLDDELSNIRIELMEYMFCGKWGNSISSVSMYVYYDDYNNTSLSSVFTNSLPTSKESGQSYYYYSNGTADGYVIGYESKLTEEKIDNYLINFNKDSISLFSYIEDKTYTLKRNENYTPPALKDNAKNAYVYIASTITDFYNPKSVVINWCWYDSDKAVCYFNASASNRVGGTLRKTYIVYKLDGNYYLFESDTEKSFSNVNVSELNNKLKSYLSKMY